MFEALTEQITRTLRNLQGVGRLTEENMAQTLKEVRSVLLSADVHFRVTREFVERVQEKCIGEEVLKTVSPGQMVVKIIHDELAQLLGEGTTGLVNKHPIRVMIVGLHGAGKTTSAVKLAHHLSRLQFKPLLVACDVQRPAAIDQLETLGQSVGHPCYADRSTNDSVVIARGALSSRRRSQADAFLFDTAGRFHLDKDLIQELIRIHRAVVPDEVLLVADSALGRESVNVATAFHEAVNLTGIVLTKLDGDARGGAALSMKAITGVPIKFMGNGEKVEDFDSFHPDRIASRILGMGDIVSLVEKAQETVEPDEAVRTAKKLERAEFNLEDFLTQMQQVKKMGSLGSLMELLPGMSGVEFGDQEENRLKRTEAIILSMTPHERRNPRLLNGSRRMRIANGSGVQVRDVNALIKQFNQMRKMMRKMKGSKRRKMIRQFAAQSRSEFPGLEGLVR